MPHLLSVLATSSWNGKVEGLNQIQAQYEQQYGPGNYLPNVFIQYWSMRVMAYAAVGLFLLAAFGAWLVYRKRLTESRWYLRLVIWATALPFVMNTAGWLLTENGRQPWIVQGLQLTRDAVSPSVSTVEVAFSLAVFFLLYAVLAVIDLVLMFRFGRQQLSEDVPARPDDGSGTPGDTEREDAELTFSY